MKKKSFVIIVVFIMIGAAGLFLLFSECERLADKDNKIITANQHQIKALTARLVSLESRLSKIEKEAKKVQPVVRNSFRNISSRNLAPKLRKIKLPLKATEKQTEKYIDEILAASKTQNTFSDKDPQVSMFAKIDHKYLQLLLDRMTGSNGPENFHISAAIVRLADETDKKVIMENLYDYPKLIDVVVNFDWQKEAKDVIFKKMGENNYLPQKWLVCAAQLAKPENYDVLINYFTKSYNRHALYNCIKDLPGIKLDAAVARVWKASRYSSSMDWNRKQMALIAADFGYVDALGVVIELRNDPNRYFDRIAYDKIYSLTGQSGSYAEVKKWFTANKDKLVFDKKAKHYHLKGQKFPELTGIPQYVPANIKPRRLSSASIAELKKIKLPPNATGKQTEEYIDKILALSKRQNSFNSNDMQLKMLKKIDHKYLPLLIKHLNGQGPERFYARLAVIALAQPSDKKLILEHLGQNPDFSSLVMKYNWYKDAKKIIFAKFESSGSLHPNWMLCAVKVAEPDDYKVLINYLIECNQKLYVYNEIKKLPGIKLDQAVETIWHASRWSAENEKKQCAFIAAQYGHADALEALLNMANDSNWRERASKELAMLTGRSGSFAEMEKWFAANKSKLVFDKKTKRYIPKTK